MFVYAIVGSKSEDELDFCQVVGSPLALKRASLPAVASAAVRASVSTAKLSSASSASGVFSQLLNQVVGDSAFSLFLGLSQVFQLLTVVSHDGLTFSFRFVRVANIEHVLRSSCLHNALGFLYSNNFYCNEVPCSMV